MTEEKGITKVMWMEFKTQILITQRLHRLHIQIDQVIFTPLYKQGNKLGL